MLEIVFNDRKIALRLAADAVDVDLLYVQPQHGHQLIGHKGIVNGDAFAAKVMSRAVAERTNDKQMQIAVSFAVV